MKLARHLVLITIILMDLLTGMEFDLFVPSFPVLQSEFSLSPFMVEALLSVNFIGYCLSLIFVGGIADRFGRKQIILLGLVIFIIGSIFCLWAGSYPLLLAGRMLQGMGVAAPAILSFLIIADSYPLKKQQYFMAMLNGVMNISVGLAPVLGSYITLYFHWQGNFKALLILGVITLVMTVIFIPAYKLPEQKQTLSFRAYVPLFRSKPLMLLMINIILMILPYWIFVGMAPLLYMQDLGVNLAHFGYYQGVLALVFALGSFLFGLVMHRYQQKKILKLTNKMFLFSLICIAVATFSNSLNPIYITLAFIPYIISQVIPSTILYPICLGFIPEAKGKISATLQGSRLVFTAIGLQIAGYFYVGTFRNIGIIMCVVIIGVIGTQYFVNKNREIMSFTK